MPRPAAPARMYLSVTHLNSQTEVRSRVIALPLITALIEPGGRYTLADPRDPLPAPPRPALKPPPSTSGRQGRPRGAMFHVERDADDPLLAALWGADDINDPLPADLGELERRG